VTSVTKPGDDDGGLHHRTIDGPLAVSLRAERSVGGGGRRYTLTVECRDAGCDSATVPVVVTVPANQGKK